MVFTEKQERPYWMVNQRTKSIGLSRISKDGENTGKNKANDEKYKGKPG